MTTWAVILAVGVGSFVLRVVPLLVLQSSVLSDTTDRTIRYAGLAAVSGLIATSVQHAAHGSSVLPTLLAVTAGTVVAVRGRSMVRIIAVGCAIYAGASVVFGLLG